MIYFYYSGAQSSEGEQGKTLYSLGGGSDTKIAVDTTYVHLYRAASGIFNNASHATTPTIDTVVTRGYIVYQIAL